MSKVTIKDVAREAGVSIGTVSNALNSGRYINPETKQRVLDAIEKLQYVPNLNGRYLKAGATKMIGFFTNSATGPYFCTLIDHMSRECWNKGYNLCMFVTKDSSVVMENLLGKRLDGAIMFEDTMFHGDDLEQLVGKKVKAIFLDREVCDEGISSIVFDSYKSAYEATRHLINLGHRNIVFLDSSDDVLDSLRRKEGFLAALEEFNLPVTEQSVVHGFFEEEYTYNTMKTFMRLYGDQMPSAFLAGNDLSAIGCIKALQSEGFRVPDDISVIGFDDIDIAPYFQPPLTTVRNPIARQAIETVDTLIAMIENDADSVLMKLEGTLIVRESCTMRK